MSILNSLGIDGSLFAAMVNEPDILENNSKTTMMRLDKEVQYKGSIAGKEINAFVTLREASLTRLSLLEQTQKSTGRDYYLVTGVMQPVRFDIDLMIEGQRINFIDVLHQIACESSGSTITRDEFLMHSSKIGVDLVGGQPLFFQQFGANIQKWEEALEVFQSAGAQCVFREIKNNTGRIKAAYQLKPGVPLTAFEVGTVDRTQSARYAHDNVGQGFLDLIDAQFDQFTRILGLRKSAKVKKTEAENSNLSEAQVVALKNDAELDMKMSKMAIRNWAGAQRRLQQLPNGSFEKNPIYDPVNLPCGRFTMATSNGLYEADLWSNNRNNVTPATSTQIAATASDPF
jgi:hypothetical protein